MEEQDFSIFCQLTIKLCKYYFIKVFGWRVKGDVEESIERERERILVVVTYRR